MCPLDMHVTNCFLCLLLNVCGYAIVVYIFIKMIMLVTMCNV